MLGKLVDGAAEVFRRFLPDPLIYALGLTALTFGLAWLAGPAAPSAQPIPLLLAGAWATGLFKILEFALQMALVLIAGHALAGAPLVQRGLRAVAGVPKGPGQAAALVTALSLGACYLNWGFGLVTAGILAREVGRRMPAVSFAVLVAAAYSGFVVWASGLSSSIALISATPGSAMNFYEKATGQVAPLGETLFARFNVVPTLALALALPLLFAWLARRVPPGEALRAPEKVEPLVASGAPTPAERLERSPLWTAIPLLLGALALWARAAQGTLQPDVNTVILLLLLLGFALHGRPLLYLAAWSEGVRSLGPLLLQYPLYGGILGLLSASTLVERLSNAAVAVSTPHTFPLLTFLSSNVVSFFVPSGGGHWAVQGPVMLPAAARLGVSPAITAMAVAVGEQTANMLQPFWALPLLAIAGLGPRDVLGYCLLTFLLSVALYGAALLWLT